MAYDFAASKQAAQDLASYHVKKFILSPNQWSAYNNPVPLTWVGVKFDSSSAQSIPTKNGVYSFVVEPGICGHPAARYLLYIGRARGKTTTLRARYKQYLTEKVAAKGRPLIQSMLNLWADHLWFYYAPVTNKAPVTNNQLIDQLEEDLIAAYLPPRNMKLPAHISKVVKDVFQ